MKLRLNYRYAKSNDRRINFTSLRIERRFAIFGMIHPEDSLF